MIEQANLQSAGAEKISALRFVRSKLFTNLFAEGMELVEETATYLDGDGKAAARDLDRSAALQYASISMRLTTRLMQIASWLLVLRAVREEEMSYKDAGEDKYRLSPRERRHVSEKDMTDAGLPERLAELRTQTNTLYDRIARIDLDLFANETAPLSGRDAMGQLQALHDAFGGE